MLTQSYSYTPGQKTVPDGSKLRLKARGFSCVRVELNSIEGDEWVVSTW